MSKIRGFDEQWFKEYEKKHSKTDKIYVPKEYGVSKPLGARSPAKSTKGRPSIQSCDIEALHEAKRGFNEELGRITDGKVFVFDIDPMPKPRMVRSDKWKKRPIVQRYWEYKRKLQSIARVMDFTLPDAFTMDFHIATKDEKRWGKPHQFRPDKDNLEKGVYDALKKNDETIWDSHVRKFWAGQGTIIIRTL